MARSGKDHFEIATRNIERVLRSEKNNKTPEIDEKEKRFSDWLWRLKEYVTFNKTHRLGLNTYHQLKQKYSEEIRKFFEDGTSFARIVVFLEEKDIERRFTRMPDRETWLKNKAIIEAKARGEWKRPSKSKEKVEKVEKKVEIIQALYGLQDIKFIDITSKIVIGQKVNNALAGEDPCPNKKKNVIVRAVVDGVEGDYTFVEGKKIIF